MTKRRPPGDDLDSEGVSMSPSPDTFNEWLERRLKASQMTQRQLALKTGVDHSTISRLIHGNRLPSLRTAAALARGLGVPDGHATVHDQSFGPDRSRAAGVEYALRSDESLTEVQVREIMEVYLAARRVHTRVAGAEASPPSQRRPVPIVVQLLAPPPRAGRRRPSVPARGDVR